jgi:hypothetical protein
LVLILKDRPADDRPLHLGDGLGDLDIARAGERALEDRPAAPDSFGIRQHRGVLSRPVIARVEQEAVRLDDGRRTEIPVVQAAHRMHLVVSSKRIRSAGLCLRSRPSAGSGSPLIRYGLISR